MKRRLYTIILVVVLLAHLGVDVVQAAELQIEKIISKADGLISDTVLVIFQDSRRTMWFGTTDGITRYDGKRFQTFTTREGLASNTIGLIFEDRRGTLWFGTGGPWTVPGKGISEGVRVVVMGNGINYFDGSEFQTLAKANGLAGNTVVDVLEDKQGNLWFATFDSGMSRYSGEKFDTFLEQGPMGRFTLPESWNELLAITQDRTGNLWLGSRPGVSYYNIETSRFRYFAVHKEGLTPFVPMGDASSGNVQDLLFDDKENLWIGALGRSEHDSGVYRYDGKKLVNFPMSEKLPMNDVKSILQDSKGNLWFTGSQMISPVQEVGAGVSVYDGKTFQNFNTQDGLPHERIHSVFEDRDGNLWLATDAGAAVAVYLSSQNADN